MKRRNAEPGKIRRPMKRTKITEGMYGNSMLYLKFVMLWATVVMVDYMLEFRFEFLWPFWMMLRSVYDSYKYQGLAFSMFFICVALTSDMICFFFIPVQYIFFAASTYVWVQYVWYTFAEKGVCVPTVAMCCAAVYVEGALRGGERGGELCRPLAAHCVGYPAVTLGVGVKAYVGQRLRLRRQRQVRALNDFYFQLMRDALPELAPHQSQTQSSTKEAESSTTGTSPGAPDAAEPKHMNGSLRRRNGKLEINGHCPLEHANLHFKLERLEKHLANQTQTRERDKCTHAAAPASASASAPAGTPAGTHAGTPAAAPASAHALSNGSPAGLVPPTDDEHKHDHSKGAGKTSKFEKKEVSSTLKEERRRNRNRDKDKDNIDSHKGTEHAREHLSKDKDLESTKDNFKVREYNSIKEREREKERETRERDREKERERDRELETCLEELRRARCELDTARAAETHARRALLAADRQRRATLQHKVALERRLGDEKRARVAAEAALQRALADDAELPALRRDLQRADDSLAALQRELARATEQLRALEAAGPGAAGLQALQERALHLERALSAETRVKLDLLSALGEAKRNMHIQEGLISRQEKEISELKAQMVAVMPPEFVLDPAAPVYTPRQLASDV